MPFCHPPPSEFVLIRPDLWGAQEHRGPEGLGPLVSWPEIHSLGPRHCCPLKKTNIPGREGIQRRGQPPPMGTGTGIFPRMEREVPRTRQNGRDGVRAVVSGTVNRRCVGAFGEKVPEKSTGGAGCPAPLATLGKFSQIPSPSLEPSHSVSKPLLSAFDFHSVTLCHT